MAIIVRPLTDADFASDAPVIVACPDFYGMTLHGNLGHKTDTKFRVYVRYLPS